ncbi:MAG: hypothetical protein KDK71_10390, partial [Chlamydiia bacterium]|nr:hypothetical protein [Chlamydiia bacterium]
MAHQNFRSFRDFYHVVFSGRKKDLLKFFFIAAPGSLAALCEGISFTFLLVSLYVFNGKGLEVLHDKPILNYIAQ